MSHQLHMQLADRESPEAARLCSCDVLDPHATSQCDNETPPARGPGDG